MESVIGKYVASCGCNTVYLNAGCINNSAYIPCKKHVEFVREIKILRNIRDVTVTKIARQMSSILEILNSDSIRALFFIRGY